MHEKMTIDEYYNRLAAEYDHSNGNGNGRKSSLPQLRTLIDCGMIELNPKPANDDQPREPITTRELISELQG